MSRLIIVIQEKGGVGKTFLAVHLTAYLRSLGIAIRPVDFDIESGVLSRVYPPPDSANISPDIELLMSGDSLLPQLMMKVLEGQSFLVDCGANTGATWSKFFQETWPTLPNELKEKGAQTTLVVPVGAEEKSRRSFEKYKTVFPWATQVMCVFKDFVDQGVPVPEHPEQLSFILPRAAPRLFNTYQERALTIDAIAASRDPALAFATGLARGYLPQLHAAFGKIEKVL